MLGLRVLLWQSDGLEEKALLPQYLVHGNDGPTSQTDFFVDSLLGVLFLGEVSSAFLPSKKTCWTHKSRHSGVGQQYPESFQDTNSLAYMEVGRNRGDIPRRGLQSVMTMHRRGSGVFPPGSHGKRPRGHR